MFLHPTEMHIQLMQMLQKRSKRRSLGHLGKGIHILWEALTAIAVLAVGTRDIGVRVVDIARKQHARMHLAPVGTHLLAVFAASVEIGDLVSTKHVVHVLGQLGLQRGHHGELLADKDLGEQLMRTGEHHGLLLEVLDEGTLGEELGHIAHLMACLARKHLAGTWEDGGSDEHRHIRKFGNQLLHESQILCAVLFSRDMDLQKSDVDVAQVIVISLGRVADEEFAFGVVVFQPILEGSTYEAASDNSYVDHNIFN